MTNTRIKIRRATSGSWAANNPILQLAEPGLETDSNKLKFGDGILHWDELQYFAPIITDHSLLTNLHYSSSGHIGFEQEGTASGSMANHTDTYNHSDILHTNRSYLDLVSGSNTGDQYIPTNLSEFNDDSTHRLVTDTEKSNWNSNISGSQVYQLYQPDGTTPFVYTDNGKNLHIDGNIIQSGSTYETHAEQVYSTKNTIILRSGSVAGLGPNEYTGIVAKNYDGVNDGRLVFDKDGYAKVGDVGSEQTLATRIDTPTNGYIGVWDDSNKRLNFVTPSSAGAIPKITSTDKLIPVFSGIAGELGSGSGLNLDGKSFYPVVDGLIKFQNAAKTSDVMVVNTSNGNVGIGTTTPDSRLSIKQVSGKGIGTVSVDAGGTLITGINTTFLVDVTYEYTITIGSETRTLYPPQENTIVYSTTPFTNTHTNEEYYIEGYGSITLSQNSTSIFINGNDGLITEINSNTGGIYGIRSSGAIKGNNFYLFNSGGGFYTNSGIPMFYFNGTDFSIGNSTTKLGIGTTTPLTKLDVTGNIRATTNYHLTGAGYFYVGETTPTADTINDTRFRNNAGILEFTRNTVANATKGAGTWVAGGIATNLIKPLVDSTDAINITKADGTTSILKVDSNSGNIGISTTTPPLSKIHIAPVTTLTGTVSINGTTTVTGVGTAFLSELSPGDSVNINGEVRIVNIVTDDLSFMTTVAYTTTASNQTATISSSSSYVRMDGNSYSRFSTTAGTITEINTNNNGQYGLRSTGPLKGNSFYLYSATGGFYTPTARPMFYTDSTDRYSVGTTTLGGLFQVNQPTAGIGTVSNTAGGTTVTGVGTKFINTFKIGDTITIGGQTVAISAIASDTSMTTAAITNANSGVAYTLVGGTRLSVAGNGNVVIGSGSATNRLNVIGDTTATKISVTTSAANGDAFLELIGRNSGVSKAANIYANYNGGLVLLPNSGDYTNTLRGNTTNIGINSEGSNLNIQPLVSAEQAPALTTGNWTLGTGWSFLTSPDKLSKNVDGTGNATSLSPTIVAGTTYLVRIICSSYSGGGYMGVRVGSTFAYNITAPGTYEFYVRAYQTTKIEFVPSATAVRCDISSISLKAVTSNTGVTKSNELDTNYLRVGHNQNFGGALPNSNSPIQVLGNIEIGNEGIGTPAGILFNVYPKSVGKNQYAAHLTMNNYLLEFGNDVALGDSFNAKIRMAGGNFTHSSNTGTFFDVTGNVTNSGTSGYNGMKINITENSLGSGSNKLIDFQTNNISKFMVMNNGNIITNGSIKIGDDATAASANNVGTMRYRTSGNNSYVEMCVQKTATTYDWDIIIKNSW